MAEVNWLAVLAATVGSFVLGGLWYSPLLFAKPWQAAAGLTDEQLKAGNPALIFGGSFPIGAFLVGWISERQGVSAAYLAAGISGLAGLAFITLWWRSQPD